VATTLADEFSGDEDNGDQPSRRERRNERMDVRREGADKTVGPKANNDGRGE
jgi:hypothetical protein